MQNWDLLLTETNIATMAEGRGAYGVIENASIAISAGRIAWIGPTTDLPAADIKDTHRMAGRWLTPALIDCHTHLVFAGI